MTLGDRLQRANWPLMGLALALTAAGIATVSTAAEGQKTLWPWLQVRWSVVGIAAALLVLAMPYRAIVQSGWVLYALGIAALVLVLFKGTGQSAGRWIGIGTFRMQPSEFMKLFLVVALAGLLRYERSHRRLLGLLGPLVLTLVPLALVMKQPDLGTALLLVPVLFAILFAAGARPKHLLLVALLGAVGAVGMFFVPGVLQPYQRKRVLSYLVTSSDSEIQRSVQQSHGHQSHSGLVAIGLGGMAGVAEEDGGAAGAARGVPERHSDFIFPVFAARWGFVGVTALLLFYLTFLGTLLGTALRVREPSGRLLVVGVFALFAAQVVMNLGMTVGLLPVVGVPLPFFSYGGSSLLTSFLALGLVLNVGSDPVIEFGRTSFAEG